MEFDYQSLRTFADSWGLLYMFLIFVAIIVYTFRPGSKAKNNEAAEIPFKEDVSHER